jgi:putative transposase
MSRKSGFLNDYAYHIYNRSIGKIPIFQGYREKALFLDSINYYLQENPPMKFSVYRKSTKTASLDKKMIVSIINYCIMPTHFHFTLKQNIENGIPKFIQRISNSFAHYFNLKFRRHGHLFEDRFKSVLVEDDEQLLHLSRYIHLNPVTDRLVENPEDYEYSSFNSYLGRKNSDIINSAIVMENFASYNDYRKFVLDQKDYQRNLALIKHLSLE